MRRIGSTRGIAFLLACTAACSSEPQPKIQESAGRQATTVAAAPTLAELRNLTYRGLTGTSGPVTLVDGSREGEPLVAGGAARPSVHFIRDFHLEADLNGDGGDEVVVLLGAGGGGTGELLHLAIVARRDGRWQNEATALLGDRVQVRAARVEAGRIVLEVVQAGAGDALCCPGDLVTRSWKLHAGALEEQPAVSTGRLDLAALTGKEWVLRHWTWDEPVVGELEVTLVVQGDRISGNSGCNRYGGTATVGAMPGDLDLGPMAATRMACVPPAAAMESRFLAQLQGVKKFGFTAGELALTFDHEGVLGTMLFTPKRQ